MKFTLKNWTFLIAFASIAIASPPSFANEAGRVETSLVGLFPLDNPTYDKVDDIYLVRGKIFDSAIVQYVYGNRSATYEVGNQYDVFEADIATNCGESNDQIRFYVLGDGNIIYRSRRLTNNDKPIHIKVPIKGYQGVTLVSEAYFRGGMPTAIWADPKLVRISGGSPSATRSSVPLPLITPPTNSTVTLRSSSDGPYEVMVNGKVVPLGSAQPVLKNESLLVPVRPLFEALGATLTFSDDNKVIVATRGNRQVILQLDSTTAYINGQLKTLDVPVESQNGTTFVPIRFLAEAFGTTIKYEPMESDESKTTAPLPYGA